MANSSIVVERETENKDKELQEGARGIVVGDVMADIIKWRQLRLSEFEDLWDEFYFKWRGFWRHSDKNFKRERSKLVAPLTSMAIDLTTAEIVEAVFGREAFIDLPDDVNDQNREDMEVVRGNLIQDLRKAGFIGEFGLCALNGSLYGTGLMKIQILTRMSKRVIRLEDGSLDVADEEIVDIKPLCIDPGAFVPDPGATNIDAMKGCAHEFILPLHAVKARQSQGVYDPSVSIGPYNARQLMENRGDTEQGDRRDKGDVAYITEYYGLVPTRHYLAAVAETNGQRIPSEMLAAIDITDMTECIVTIANETTLLRIIENPLITGERLIISYQHEQVPGRFWGRGVCEKAANVQRAMDAEMRARIDSLAWSNNPMFAGDLTRLPPGTNLSAWPGKFWGTRGNPKDIIQEFRINGPDPNTFQHMQDLERMGQQATGALDSIMSLRAGVRDETATGSALSAAGFIKRSKRTMYNIEDFLAKLAQRTARLKMQFDADRYPLDVDFQVRGTVGIMSREIEAQFMVNLLNTVGADTPMAMPIIKAIFENSASPVKADVLAAIEAIENKKPTPEEQAAQAAQLRAPVLENVKTKAEIAKLFAEAGLKDAMEDNERQEGELLVNQAALDALKAFNDLQETENQVRQLDILEDKNDIEREKIRRMSNNSS